MSAVAKVERLLSLVNLLLGAPKAISAEDLRRRISGYPEEDASFKRAFERDKDELREMGVPLLVETIPGSDPPLLGYRIRTQDYELRLDLDPEELQALRIAAALTGLDGGAAQQGLLKLGGGAAGAPQAELPADPNLAATFTAVAEHRVIGFAYRGVAREVHPYRLEFVNGRWYVNGFDRVRGDDRWYRLDRIEDEVVHLGPPNGFAAPVEAVRGLRLDPWVLGDQDDPVDAEVWFDPAVAGTVRADLEDEAVLSDDADGLVVRMRVTNRAGFRSWIVAFLDRAEVRAPVDLRAEIVDWLRLVAAGAPR